MLSEKRRAIRLSCISTLFGVLSGFGLLERAPVVIGQLKLKGCGLFPRHERELGNVKMIQGVLNDEAKVYSVHAKPRLSQINVRQNLSATGINFGFTCHHDRHFCQIMLYIQ